MINFRLAQDSIALYGLVCVSTLAAALWQPESKIEGEAAQRAASVVRSPERASVSSGATDRPHDLVTLALASASSTPEVALLPSRP